MVVSDESGLAGLMSGDSTPEGPTTVSTEPSDHESTAPQDSDADTAADGSSDNDNASIPTPDTSTEASAETEADVHTETESETETGSAEIEVEAETTPWVSQPFGYLPTVGGFPVTNGMVLAALGVILALLAVLLLSTRKKKPSEAGKVSPVQEPARQDVTSPIPPVASVASKGIRAAYHQHIGARNDQQDSCTYSDPTLYSQRGMLAVVADGMGGLANGKAVSSTLVRIYDEGFHRAHPQQNSADLLLELAVRANAQVNRMLLGKERSGSTLVAALVKNGYLNFLTVGDSRIYLYRGGALIQLNREHIYQEELAVKAVNRAVPLNQVREDRQAHSLTSYLGIGRIPALDRNDEGIKLINGDRILLATDGVFGTLSAAQLETALAKSVNDAATMIGDMIRAADKPYQDNNTAVILEYFS